MIRQRLHDDALRAALAEPSIDAEPAVADVTDWVMRDIRALSADARQAVETQAWRLGAIVAATAAIVMTIGTAAIVFPSAHRDAALFGELATSAGLMWEGP